MFDRGAQSAKREVKEAVSRLAGRAKMKRQSSETRR